MPHADLSDDCKGDYEEARNIVAHSPRGAAALLRLVLQKLCKKLGQNEETLDKCIAAMVKKGLPVQMQKACDVVRITGNNAVHPGELNLQDTPELVMAMFKLINMIVEDMITKPKELDAFYEIMPARAHEAIAKRDGKNT